MKSKRCNCETCGHRVPRSEHGRNEWTQCPNCVNAKREHAPPEPDWALMFNFAPVKVYV